MHEAQLRGAINRSERFDGIYQERDGILNLDETRFDVPSWSGAELAGYVAGLRALIHSDGGAFAA